MNEEVFRLIFQFAHRSSFLDQVGVFLANYLPYLMVLAAGVLIFYKRDWRERFFYLIAMALSVVVGRGIISGSLRFFYPALRPYDALDIEPLFQVSGYSFPSGHAVILFAVSMIVFYINRRWGFWFLILASINALARVFSGVHFPLDILAGAAIGVLSGFLVFTILKSYLNQLGFHKGEVEVEGNLRSNLG